MQTLKSYWTSANLRQKVSLVIIAIAILVVSGFGFAFPQFGIAVLLIASCFIVSSAFATLVVYPIKRK